MRIVVRTCEKCGDKYGYKVSGGGSPREWNDARGVTWKYCAECSPKTFITPELHCPPLSRLRSWLRMKVHNWLMWHSAWYRKRWRCGREPQEMYRMGPVTPKPFPRMDLSGLYSMEFDIKDRKKDAGKKG